MFYVIFCLAAGLLLLGFYCLVADVVARRRFGVKKGPANRPLNKPRWVQRDELRPDVAQAYEAGRMSHDQMVELLRAGGWDARRTKDGAIVIDTTEES